MSAIPSDAPDASGDASRFRTTNWDLVTGAADSASADWTDAIESLCKIYWSPVYAFIRSRGHPRDAAEDLTQGFFAQLLQSDFLSAADSERGRFRCFLMASVDNFLRVQHRNATTQKRGGGWTRVPLDDKDVERVIQSELADRVTPEVVFERQWVRALLSRVLGMLGEEFAEGGRSELFEALKPHLSRDPGALPYQEIAARASSILTGIKVTLHRARKRYHDLLRIEVARVVLKPSEVDDELRHLLQVLC